MKSKEKKERARHSFVTGIQKLYLSIVFFFTNDLLSYASACAFGFLFSFVPVLMLVLVILIRFFHTSSDTIEAMLGGASFITDFLNLDSVANTITGIKKITNFEIILGITIVWMARRFFSSIIGSINRIFHTQVPSRPMASQTVIMAAEASMVILSSLIVILNIAFKTVTKLPIFLELSQMFPHLLGTFTERMVMYLPYVIIFFAVFISYRFSSRSGPSSWTCFWCTTACTVSFFVMQKFMGIFLNVNRYNMIYGVLSNIIVLLLEVFFFFTIYLACAEMVFVSQYFDTLLLSEIYRLPDRDDTRFYSSFRRLLFIRPDYLLKTEENVIRLKKGDRIYHSGDEGKFMFYIRRGTVQIIQKNHIEYVDSGCFFGEGALLMDGIRKEEAIACSDLTLIKISDEKFYAILQKNPQVAAKAMSKISRYFAWTYNNS